MGRKKGGASKKSGSKQCRDNNGKTKRKPRSSLDHHSTTTKVDDGRFRCMMEDDGLEIIDVAADGNCLFRSLSDQLYGDYGNRHDQVRSDVCEFMENNKDDFSVFLVFEDDDDEDQNEEDAKDFESYIATMREDGEWGGDLELVAAARLYQRKITVYSATLGALSMDHGETRSTSPDLLVSYHDNEHYNSVRRRDAPPTPINGPTSRTNSRSISSSDNGDGDQGNDQLEEGDLNALSTGEEHTRIVANPKKKVFKKSAPCPCGSGQKYKKCCSVKDKRASRLESVVKMQDTDDDGSEEAVVAMKGNFRVLSI